MANLVPSGACLSLPCRVEQTIGFCRLLRRAFGPRDFVKKWGSLDVAGRAGQHGKPAKAGCGQNWPPLSSGTDDRFLSSVAEGLRPARFREEVGEPGCRRAGWAAPEAGCGQNWPPHPAGGFLTPVRAC